MVEKEEIPLTQAITRLKTVEYRLRHGRKKHDADIIANEVLPVLKDIESVRRMFRKYLKPKGKMNKRLWCANCREKQIHRLNGVGMLICTKCGCYRDMPSRKSRIAGKKGRKNHLERIGDYAQAALIRDEIREMQVKKNER